MSDSVSEVVFYNYITLHSPPANDILSKAKHNICLVIVNCIPIYNNIIVYAVLSRHETQTMCSYICI